MTHETTTTDKLEDIRHVRLQRREWKAERLGAIAIALLLFAALLGLLGSGPFTHCLKTSSDGQLSAEYYSVQRYDAPAKMTVRFKTREKSSSHISLGISRTFVDHIDLEAMIPPPEYVEMQKERLVYHFRTSELTDEGVVVLRYKNNDLGTNRFVVDHNGSRVECVQFVLP